MSFWGWIANLPMFVQVILITLSTLGSVFLLYKGFVFKWGSAKFSLRGRKGKEELILIMCSSMSDAYRIVHEIDKIDFKLRTKEQMVFVDQKILEMRAIFQKRFLNLLEEKFQKSDMVNTPYFKHYKIILNYVIQEITDIIRVNLKENNYDTMEESDFDVYVSNKVEELKNTEIDFMDLLYYDLGNLPREVIYEANRDISAQAGKIIEDIFRYGRKIALQKKQQIEELKKEFELIPSRIVEKII